MIQVGAWGNPSAELKRVAFNDFAAREDDYSLWIR